MTDHQGDLITIIGRKTTKEPGDRVELEWELSARPPLQWAEIFQMASPAERHGSVEWVRGGGPDVIGEVVRWFVPASEVEQADLEVRERLTVANQRFSQDPPEEVRP
ncbi:MAG TPA: hypothetical protein VND70_02135 [Acidimicrobiales bacterium]|nr:hypothetical protein [Acidimicrobiales bacterium]